MHVVLCRLVHAEDLPAEERAALGVVQPPPAKRPRSGEEEVEEEGGGAAGERAGRGAPALVRAREVLGSRYVEEVGACWEADKPAASSELMLPDS